MLRCPGSSTSWARGGERNREVASNWPARLVEVVVACRPCCRCWSRLCRRARHWCSGQRRRLGHRPAVEPDRQRSAAGDAALLRLTRSTTPVRLHRLGLHNINYARSLEGLGPLVLPSNYASEPVAVQQLIITDEERGDRGLSEFSGLDASLNTAAMAAAVGNTDPTPPAGYHLHDGRLDLRPGLHAARRRLCLDVQRRLRRDQCSTARPV